MAIFAIGIISFSGSLGAEVIDQSAKNSRPNIVLIVADDMGFSDLGCYGGEICTPNLDQLAARGMRFSRYYNFAACCLTRGALMTGLYPWQVGVGGMMNDFGQEGYRGDLNRRCVTLAEVLRRAGYGTYMTGKWHLTRHIGEAAPKENWPLQRGFDDFYGTIEGGGNYFQPSRLIEGNQPFEGDLGDNYFYTKAISDHAARFIRDHAASRRDDPFFLYVAYTAPHAPLQAIEEDIARYRDLYLCGWDEIRENRFQKLKQLNLISEETKLSPHAPGVPAWKELSGELQKKCLRRMEVYAAQVDELDQGIGEIVGELRATGQFANTMIIFLSDNGPESSGGISGWGRIEDELVGTVHSDSSYGQAWANVSNTPFRGFKTQAYEGGTISPLIVHWPTRIKNAGSLNHTVSHVVDIMPTLVEASGAEYPEKFNGSEIQPLKGVSLMPAFDGKHVERGPLFWEFNGNRAIRVADWKLVADRGKAWELYDLKGDPSEVVNLAALRPELVEQMEASWKKWAKRMKIMPWPEPKANSAPEHFSTRSSRFFRFLRDHALGMSAISLVLILLTLVGLWRLRPVANPSK